MTNPIVINNWQAGTADHPLLGLGVVKNATVYNLSGLVKPTNATASQVASGTKTFTANPTTDVCTLSSTSSFTNQTDVAVTLTTTGTLPAGLSTGTTYFIIQVDANAGTFKLATNKANADGGTAIDITDAGTGTHTITITAMGSVDQSGIAQDKSGNIYVVDSNGRVWCSDGTGSIAFFLLPGNTTTSASGFGLQTFTTSDGSATYLFVFRNAVVDVMDITSTTKRNDPVGQTAWTNSWQSLNTVSGTSNQHQCILGQDNILYFCDDRYVGSILEKAGSVFSPSSSATYTFNNKALKLPQGELAWSLEQLGLNILVGGKNTNKIYPWDRSSATFTLPLLCAEKAIYRMKNINNMVYILAGVNGNIYRTNGSFIWFERRVPEFLMTNIILNWGGIDASFGHLVFGIGTNSQNSYYGMWRLTPDGVLTLDNVPAAGAAQVNAILVSQNSIYLGSANGIDAVGPSGQAAFGSVIQSQFYEVGTKTKPGKFSEIEVQVPSSSGTDQIRVSYRTDLNASFTTITTFTMNGSTTSFKADAGLTSIENIQIQVEFGGVVQISEVRLIP